MTCRYVRCFIVVFISSFVFISPLQAQEIIFEDDFEADELGPEWIATPGPNGGFVGLVSAGQASQSSVGLGKSFDGVLTTNTLDLPLDLSPYIGERIDLSFWIIDIVDNTHPEDGIYFSDNGGTDFTKVYDFAPSGWNNLWGALPPLDVVKLANEFDVEINSDFVIRFQQRGEDDFSGANVGEDQDGFYIDNVVVSIPDLTFATLPFFNGFETGSLESFWRWGTPASTLAGGGVTVRPGGRVEVAQGVGISDGAGYGVLLGRRSDGSSTTNALDLYLDLEGEEDVELSFWILDIIDNTNTQDGLFFSDDGGASFVKVYGFNTSGWSTVYGQLPPLDVDELAEENGLSLTSEFIIRFQQHGADDFSGSNVGEDQDGYYLDNISVRRSDRTYVTIPFIEDFESGVLEPWWEWGVPVSTLGAGNVSIRPGGRVDVLQGVGIDEANNYGVYMGRRIDGALTTNALDLFLDLSEEEEVELSFWWRDILDNTHQQDGLLLSDDGGDTFEKVYDFDPSARANSYARVSSLDLDVLAESVGLTLSSTFVIRFQQHGEDDTSGSNVGEDQDGFYFDNIEVVEGEAGIIVWPGDTNTDGVVNQADILPIGLYWGQTGPARTLASSSWGPQDAKLWNLAPATYADANGSGAIGSADVLPIGLNWGLTTGVPTTRPAQLAAKVDRAGSIRLDVREETENTLSVEVLVDDVTDFMGAAVALTYPEHALALRAIEPGDWLGNELVTQANIEDETGAAEFGFVRKRGEDGLNGGGLVASLVFDKSATVAHSSIEIVEATAGYLEGDTAPMTISESVFSVSIDDRELPTESTLGQPYPNPFADRVTIPYTLSETKNVELTIFDVAGRRIRALSHTGAAPGTHELVWDGRDDSGAAVASGLYILYWSSGSQAAHRNIVLVR